MAEILVVEDYPPMALLLTRMLRKLGHRVEREFSTKGALRHERVFEHAVLDIDLPDGDGVTLAEQLLSRRRVNSFVFFTATKDAFTLSRAARLGLVVNKSEGLHRLVSVIKQLERSACQTSSSP